MDKPRVKYEDVFAVKARVNPFTPYSMAWLMERYIHDMNGWGGNPPIRPLGETNFYKLKQLQGMPIGAIDAAKLTDDDVKDHCRSRINDDKVSPATVMHDFTAMRVVLKYAPSEWRDCKHISHKALKMAKPALLARGLIGKSTPRTRTPTAEEEAQLVAFFQTPKRKPASNEITAMPDMIRFALKSSRRCGEICRIRRPDVNWENKDKDGNRAPLYMVRDVKDPKKKVGNHMWFPLFPELEEILLRQPEKPGDDRWFPFRAKSVSAKYTRAKRVLGIKGLRFHDNRREAITRALAQDLTPHQVRHYYSGHKTTVMLERVYDATKPDGGFAAVKQAERPAA